MDVAEDTGDFISQHVFQVHKMDAWRHSVCHKVIITVTLLFCWIRTEKKRRY